MIFRNPIVQTLLIGALLNSISWHTLNTTLAERQIAAEWIAVVAVVAQPLIMASYRAWFHRTWGYSISWWCCWPTLRRLVFINVAAGVLNYYIQYGNADLRFWLLVGFSAGLLPAVINTWYILGALSPAA